METSLEREYAAGYPVIVAGYLQHQLDSWHK